jgi:hypothetical protein
MEKIKFIRALWGDLRERGEEPLYDEMVYVWGVENEKLMRDRGFETYLVSEDKWGGIGERVKFLNKLKCWEIAATHYERFIFLDWDVVQVKELDEDFWNQFDDEKKILMPTYSYPAEYLDLENKLEDQGAREWVNAQIGELRKSGYWELEDLIVLPNAGFFYCADINFPKELVKTVYEKDLLSVVDEFSMFVHVDENLQSYIEKYEPACIYGRSRESNFVLGPISRRVEPILHDYIDKLIKKNVYFVHE